MIILPTNTLQLIILLLNNKQFIQFKQFDCASWLHLNTSYVLGNKIVKPISEPSFANQGNLQFFYEVVQYWVAFELVQVFHKYGGLNPMFKSNLNKLSKDLYWMVQFLKKKHKQKMRRNVLKSVLKSFSNLKKQSTMDHSYVVNMAQE
jgi:hypothetical protein